MTVSWNSVSKELLTPQQVKDTLARVTPESLADTAAKLFDPENQQVYLSGPFGPLGWRAARKFARGG